MSHDIVFSRFGRAALRATMALAWSFASSAALDAAPATPAQHLIGFMYGIACDPVESKKAGADATGAATALASGDTALQRGRCRTAIADYGTFVDAQPDDVKGYWRRAVAEAAESLSQTNFYDGFDLVNADIGKAIALKPDIAGFYVLSGYSNLMQGQALFRHPGFLVERKAKKYYQSGYDDCSKAIGLSAASGEAYTMRYRIDTANKDDQKAQEDAQQAGRLDGDGFAHAQKNQDGVAPQLDDDQTAREKAAIRRYLATMTAAGL